MSQKTAAELVEYKRDRVRANASRPLTHSLEQSKEGLAVNATQSEVWRPAVGLANYEVSNLGRVRSKDWDIVRRNGSPMRRKGKVLSQFSGLYGHRRVQADGELHYVHRLVLEAFVGQARPGEEACHNDGNPANNQLSNLLWDGHLENMADVSVHGTHGQARKTHCKRGHEFTAENTYRMSGGGRQCKECCRIRKREYREPGYQGKRRDIFCMNGHEFTDENTYVTPRGTRRCRICIRERMREQRLKKRG